MSILVVILNLFSDLFLFGAAAPKGTMSCRIQGKPVHTSVRLSVCLSIPHPSHNQPAPVGPWMDRRTHRFALYSIGHLRLWGRCPTTSKNAIAMFMGRATVLLDMYCLRRMALSFSLQRPIVLRRLSPDGDRLLGPWIHKALWAG